MWQIMMFGQKPFILEDGELKLNLSPCLPEYLIKGEKTLETTFLGSIKVTYHTGGMESLIPGSCQVEEILLTDREGKTQTLKQVRGKQAEKFRAGFYEKMEVKFMKG